MRDARIHPERYPLAPDARAFSKEQELYIRREEGEHYEAQAEYAQMLFTFLEIPKWRHPIKSFKALMAAERYRDSHKACCEWANEVE